MFRKSISPIIMISPLGLYKFNKKDKKNQLIYTKQRVLILKKFLLSKRKKNFVRKCEELQEYSLRFYIYSHIFYFVMKEIIIFFHMLLILGAFRNRIRRGFIREQQQQQRRQF